MSLVDSIFNPHNHRKVDNPITLKKNDCILLNTKKDKYYIHTYDPNIIFDKLKREFKISDEILSRFDNTRRTNCCNAISITLYFTNCENMGHYLDSIYRTVKNTLKKLDDWIVRVYLDISVYKCIEEIQTKLTSSSINDKTRIQYTNIIKSFETIITSSNVEIYTFQCDTIIEIEKKRTLRYLILIDPDVNISAIREADGFLSYVECHNLKMFASSDRLFYLPPIIVEPLTEEDAPFFNYSYSKWLCYYKCIFEKDFFSNYGNIYDLLAGLFTTKLKIKHEYYYDKINSLRAKIAEFKILKLEGKKAKYPDYIKDIMIVGGPGGRPQMYKSLHELFDRTDKTNTFEDVYRVLDIGFDEIFLLDIFKEIISIPLQLYNKDEIEKMKTLFYAHDIISLEYKNIQTLIEELKRLNIISRTFLLDEKYKILFSSSKFIEYSIIDSLIFNNITYTEPFNIKLFSKSILDSLNSPYNLDYDKYYDTENIAIMNKYLKYKNKYLQLKNELRL